MMMIPCCAFSKVFFAICTKECIWARSCFFSTFLLLLFSEKMGMKMGRSLTETSVMAMAFQNLQF